MLQSQLVSSVGGWKEVSFAPNQKPSLLPPPGLGLGEGKVGWRAQGASAPHPGISSVHISALEWLLDPWIAVKRRRRKESDKVQGRALTVLIAAF